MRRKLPLALAAAAALAAGGCSTSPCQRLGEKLCSCTGLASDVCTTQVEDQLKNVEINQDVISVCQKFLDACNAPPNTIFCEWINTDAGKEACGFAPEVATTTVP